MTDKKILSHGDIQTLVAEYFRFERGYKYVCVEGFYRKVDVGALNTIYDSVEKKIRGDYIVVEVKTNWDDYREEFKKKETFWNSGKPYSKFYIGCPRDICEKVKEDIIKRELGWGIVCIGKEILYGKNVFIYKRAKSRGLIDLHIDRYLGFPRLVGSMAEFSSNGLINSRLREMK